MGESGEEQASERIVAEIEGWDVFRDASRVLLFSALRGEPSLLTLLNSGQSKEFCFPKVENDQLRVFGVQSLDQLSPGKFGILEPVESLATEIPPSEIELALIPGVAFGRKGERLGRGGGFFDRFLPMLSPDALIAGVCFQCQVFDNLPVESHDFPVNALVSDTGVLRF